MEKGARVRGFCAFDRVFGVGGGDGYDGDGYGGYGGDGDDYRHLKMEDLARSLCDERSESYAKLC